MCHPKHKEWAALADASPTLSALNLLGRAGFFLAYMGMRAIYFPYVVFGAALPDLMHWLRVPPAERAGVSDAALQVPVLLAALFCLLQWYWAYLLVKMVAKMLIPQKAKTG